MARPRAMWIGLFAAGALTLAAVATASGVAKLGPSSPPAGAQQP